MSMPSVRRLLAGALVVAGLLTVPGTSATAYTFRPVELVNPWENLRVDVIGASSNSYQGAFLWENNDSRSQEFDVLPASNGWFILRARHSNKCLVPDPRVHTYDNGDRIVQVSNCKTDYPINQWKVRYVGNRRHADQEITPTLINRYTGMCMDAGGQRGWPYREAILQHWDCIGDSGDWNANNQIFYMRELR